MQVIFAMVHTSPKYKSVSDGVYFYRLTKSVFYAGFSVMKTTARTARKAKILNLENIIFFNVLCILKCLFYRLFCGVVLSGKQKNADFIGILSLYVVFSSPSGQYIPIKRK